MFHSVESKLSVSIKSIGREWDVEANLRHVEEDFKTQVDNALAIKDLIHEDKDLISLVGSEEQYRKYMYALGLRTDATSKIGIENIRLSRLGKLEKERTEIAKTHEAGRRLFPEFRPVFIAAMEAGE